MLRCLIAIACLTVSVSAALLPEGFGSFRRSGPPSAATLDASDKPLWEEYGFREGETAEYSDGTQTRTVTVWRFQDYTGAYAAGQALNTSSPLISANYVVRVDGGKLPDALTDQLTIQLPNRVSTSPPPLLGQLPEAGRVKGSERYLLGNTALSRFASVVPAELAGLDRGAEAVIARYRIGGTEVPLTLISYPTPQMAMAFTKKFEAQSGLMYQRHGPLIAVVPVGGEASTRVRSLLGKVRYQPNVSWSEHVPKDTPQDAARMILAIFMLAGILIVLSLIFGVFFGGSRVLAQKLGFKSADEGFTSLGLGNK